MGLKPVIKTARPFLREIYHFSLISALALVFLSLFIATVNTLWSENLSIGGYAYTGFWITPSPTPAPEGLAGTSVTAGITAVGLAEKSETGIIIHVRGEICAANNGDRPTENLQITDTIQFKSDQGKYQDLYSQNISVNENPALDPGETHCYPYEITFNEPQGGNVKYRNTALVTITNHSGWMTGSNNCPGVQPCPFGPNVKVEFEILLQAGVSVELLASPSPTYMVIPTETATPIELPTATEPPAEVSTPTEAPTESPPQTETPSSG
ncbi:MAG: hypothetical protein HY864_16355 [Chloroflexi bacterium]|nr:hypothetical protein [Chloroflexota bacterium]